MRGRSGGWESDPSYDADLDAGAERIPGKQTLVGADRRAGAPPAVPGKTTLVEGIAFDDEDVFAEAHAEATGQLRALLEAQEAGDHGAIAEAARQLRAALARVTEAAPAGPASAMGPRLTAMVELIGRAEPALRDASMTGPAPAPSGRSAGGGALLPGAVRADMERAFSADFSTVRIHEGAQAQLWRALAFTEGEDIHVAPGAMALGSSGGRALLGHELTHVLQQRAGSTMPQARRQVLDAGPLEAQAEDLGARAARGERVNACAILPASGGIQRHVSDGLPKDTPVKVIATGAIGRIYSEESDGYQVAIGAGVQSFTYDELDLAPEDTSRRRARPTGGPNPQQQPQPQPQPSQAMQTDSPATPANDGADGEASKQRRPARGHMPGRAFDPVAFQALLDAMSLPQTPVSGDAASADAEPKTPARRAHKPRGPASGRARRGSNAMQTDAPKPSIASSDTVLPSPLLETDGVGSDPTPSGQPLAASPRGAPHDFILVLAGTATMSPGLTLPLATLQPRPADSNATQSSPRAGDGLGLPVFNRPVPSPSTHKPATSSQRKSARLAKKPACRRWYSGSDSESSKPRAPSKPPAVQSFGHGPGLRLSGPPQPMPQPMQQQPQPASRPRRGSGAMQTGAMQTDTPSGAALAKVLSLDAEPSKPASAKKPSRAKKAASAKKAAGNAMDTREPAKRSRRKSGASKKPSDSMSDSDWGAAAKPARGVKPKPANRRPRKDAAPKPVEMRPKPADRSSEAERQRAYIAAQNRRLGEIGTLYIDVNAGTASTEPKEGAVEGTRSKERGILSDRILAPHYVAEYRDEFYTYTIELVTHPELDPRGYGTAREAALARCAAPFKVVRRVTTAGRGDMGRPHSGQWAWRINPRYAGTAQVVNLSGELRPVPVGPEGLARITGMPVNRHINHLDPNDYVELYAPRSQPFIFYREAAAVDESHPHDGRRSPTPAVHAAIASAKVGAGARRQSQHSRRPKTDRKARVPNKAMDGSANKQVKGGFPADRNRGRLASHEWCHLVGDGDGGKCGNMNLVIGTNQVNTEQLALEEALREFLPGLAELGLGIYIDATAVGEELDHGRGRTVLHADWISYTLSIRSRSATGPVNVMVLSHLMDARRGTMLRGEFEGLRRKARAEIQTVITTLTMRPPSPGPRIGNPTYPSSRDAQRNPTIQIIAPDLPGSPEWHARQSALWARSGSEDASDMSSSQQVAGPANGTGPMLQRPIPRRGSAALDLRAQFMATPQAARMSPGASDRRTSQAINGAPVLQQPVNGATDQRQPAAGSRKRPHPDPASGGAVASDVTESAAKRPRSDSSPPTGTGPSRAPGNGNGPSDAVRLMGPPLPQRPSRSKGTPARRTSPGTTARGTSPGTPAQGTSPSTPAQRTSPGTTDPRTPLPGVGVAAVASRKRARTEPAGGGPVDEAENASAAKRARTEPPDGQLQVKDTDPEANLQTGDVFLHQRRRAIATRVELVGKTVTIEFRWMK